MFGGRLKLGFRIWSAMLLLLAVACFALQFSGNARVANALWMLSYVCIGGLFFTIGKFQGLKLGESIGGRPHFIQYALDHEHKDWFDEDTESLEGAPSPNDGNRISHVRSLPNTVPLNSKAFGRLTKAIEEFPLHYPNYQKKVPKLDDDIRPWLKSSHGASDREAHVFGVIISEHFQLSPDTPKS